MHYGFQGYARPAFFCKQCAAGRFGSAPGLKSPACSGLCREGHFCPAGSTSDTQFPCGGTHLYCPEGSPRPISAAAGRYTISRADITANTTAAYEVSTAVGDVSQRIAQLLCPRGSYCKGGVAELCPIGRYGNITGLQTADCNAPCGDGTYCPAGSVLPTPCPQGFYCPDGKKPSICPAGTYGSEEGSEIFAALVIHCVRVINLVPLSHLCRADWPPMLRVLRCGVLLPGWVGREHHDQVPRGDVWRCAGPQGQRLLGPVRRGLLLSSRKHSPQAERLRGRLRVLPCGIGSPHTSRKRYCMTSDPHHTYNLVVSPKFARSSRVLLNRWDVRPDQNVSGAGRGRLLRIPGSLVPLPRGDIRRSGRSQRGRGQLLLQCPESGAHQLALCAPQCRPVCATELRAHAQPLHRSQRPDRLAVALREAHCASHF
jgi:hypothetical protein